MSKLTKATRGLGLIAATMMVLALPAAAPLCQASQVWAEESGEKWCCCGDCCGYAVDCSAVPGCTSC